MMHKERAWDNDPRQLSSQWQARFKLVFLVCILHAASKFDTAENFDEVSSSSSGAVPHKYLQVKLLADENVAAKHGNNTADFLLVLANIVSTRANEGFRLLIFW